MSFRPDFGAPVAQENINLGFTGLSQSKYVYDITSDNRISGVSHDFQIELNIPPGNTFDSVTMIEASISKTWYAVEAGRNTFTLQGEAGNTAPVTIQPGNYAIVDATATGGPPSLLTALALALDAAALVIAGVTGNGPWVFTVAFLNATGNILVTFARGAGDTGGAGALIFPTSRLAKVLGFLEAGTYPFAGDALTSPSFANLQPNPACYIRMSGIDGDLLEVVPSGNSAFFSMLQYSNGEPVWTSRPLTTRAGNSVQRIRITDYEGVPINLNGGVVLMTVAYFESGRESFRGVQLS